MGLAFASCKPKGDCDRHATRLKNGGVLCAVVLGWLLPTAVTASGLSSEGNTDGVLTWQLGRVEAGQSAVRTVLLAYADSLEQLTSVVEAAKQKARGLGGDAPASGATEAEIAWLRNATTSFGLERTGSFSAVGHRPALGHHLYHFNWYIRYNDGIGKTAGVPLWSNTKWLECGSRNDLENMRMVGALSSDRDQAAAISSQGLFVRASSGLSR